MPRTKRPVRRQEKSVEEDEVLKKLNKLGTEQKKKIDSRVLMDSRNIELAFKILQGSLNNYLQKTVGQLRNELYLKEVSTRTTHQSNRSGSHDDGYLTEHSTHGSGERGAVKPKASSSSSGRSTFRPPPSSSSRSTGRRSRSADPTSVRKPPTASRVNQRRRSRSVYRTPAYNKNASVNYPAITPKVTPHMPLTVLRQPRQGEMVVSMSGSPVMVPTCYTMQREEKANCNILLEDGTMLSLQPKHLRQSQAYIPFSLMDSNVLGQLKTLKDNLETVVKLGEKAIVK